MPFVPKSWLNSPSTSTPISAAALQDLETRLSDYTDDRVDPVENSVDAIEAVTVVVAAPTGTEATDRASWEAALTAGAGGTVIGQPGTYVVAPASAGQLLIPDDTTVILPVGCTVQAAPNIATGAGNYVMFAGAGSPPTNVHIVIDGLLDGNRRNGNHGLSEDIHAITMSEGQDCTATGHGKIYNWRGEAAYFGQTGGGVGGTAPKNCKVLGLTIEDVGVKEVGDSGNPRQGVAFVSGTDCIVDYCTFDTIGGYGVDFEGDFANNHFDGCVAGPNNTFRNVGQGSVNLTTPGTVYPTNRMHPGQISGPQSTANTTNTSPNLTSVSPTTGWTNGCAVSGPGIPVGTYIVSGAGTATMVMSQNATATATGIAIDGVPSVSVVPIPANRARYVQKRRASTDLTLNSTSWADVDTGLDITLPAQVGDIIEVGLSAQWGGEGVWTQLDVATVVGGSPVSYFGANGASSPGASGISGWRGPASLGVPVGGSVFLTLADGDVRNGVVLIRLRYSTNVASNRTLNATADTPLHFHARNLGPGW